MKLVSEYKPTGDQSQTITELAKASKRVISVRIAELTNGRPKIRMLQGRRGISMIVKDLLSQCTTDEIVAEIIHLSRADENKREKIYFVHEKFISQLKRMEPVIKDFIIFGVSRVEDGKKNQDICLYSKFELRKEFSRYSAWGNIKNMEVLSDEEIENLLQEQFFPSGFAFELSPWEEVLGYEVDEHSVSEFGAPCILANVIYEMTFFGFTKEQVDREREKLEESLAEAEKIDKLPLEEREKYYIPAEKVFEELGYRDERTDEEKEEERKKWRREILYNQLQKYLAVKRYMEKQRGGIE